MAKKQSRRSVSLNRALYDATKTAAAECGVTASHLVAIALRAYGVPVGPQKHFTPDAARAALIGKRAKGMGL
jgi:hypothetical protein